MLTATLLGLFGVEGVVVGPLKQQSAASSFLQVSSGIMLVPPCFCHHSSPPSHVTNLTLAPLAFTTRSIASVSSGPVPSPLISATVFKIRHPPFVEDLILVAWSAGQCRIARSWGSCEVLVRVGKELGTLLPKRP